MGKGTAFNKEQHMTASSDFLHYNFSRRNTLFFNDLVILVYVCSYSDFQIPLAVEPPQTGSRTKISRTSKALLIGGPIIAIFTALVVGIWIKRRQKNLVNQGAINIFESTFFYLYTQ